jgi:hypothetical protein
MNAWNYGGTQTRRHLNVWVHLNMKYGGMYEHMQTTSYQDIEACKRAYLRVGIEVLRYRVL